MNGDSYSKNDDRLHPLSFHETHKDFLFLPFCPVFLRLLFSISLDEGAASRLMRDTQTLGLVIGLAILVLLLVLLMMDLIFYVKFDTGALFFLKTALCVSSQDKPNINPAVV